MNIRGNHYRFVVSLLLFACFGLISSASALGAEVPVKAALCHKVDLITGAYTRITELSSGSKGFMLAMKSEAQGSLLLNIAWEVKNAPGLPAGLKLGEESILLPGGKTKFAAFKAPVGGINPGVYQLILGAPGFDDRLVRFAVKKKASSESVSTAAAASSATAGKAEPAAPRAGREQNAAQALEEVFKTKQGPEAAAAGAEVVTKFLEKGLSASSPKSVEAGPKPAAKKTQVGRAELKAGTPAGKASSPPAAAKTSGKVPKVPLGSLGKAPAIKPLGQAKAKSGPVAPSARNQIKPPAGVEALPGISAMCASLVNKEKAPIDPSPEFSDGHRKIYFVFKTDNPAYEGTVKVLWKAVSVEGMNPDQRVSSSREVLQKSGWRTAVFSAPKGGFWSGGYQAVMTRGKQILAKVDFSIKSETPAAPLASEAAGVSGANLALAALGGKLESITSQNNDTYWAGENLIDGFGYGGKSCSPRCGWASKGKDLPQEMVFSFYKGKEATISGVLINSRSCPGDAPCLASLPRLVEVWVSSKAPDKGWRKVAQARLRPVTAEHFMALPKTRARFVKLVIRSNYGSSRRTQLAEVKILEAGGGPSLVAELERDLAMPGLGGSLVRYTSEKYSRPAALVLKPGKKKQGWRSADAKLPQEFVFAFINGQQALIDRVELSFDPGAAPGSRPALISIELSDIGPMHGFQEVLREKMNQQSGNAVFKLNKKARFLKLRILENHGAKYSGLGKVCIIEARRPGYVSVLSRGGAFTPGLVKLKGPSIEVTSAVKPAERAAGAPLLEMGKRLKAGFDKYGKAHFYSLELKGDRPGQLNLELMGHPFLRVKLTLTDHRGEKVAGFDPDRNSPRRTMISWRVKPGKYGLKVETAPANIVLAWDNSGSMKSHSELVKKAVTGFVERVRPSEYLNLIPFNDKVRALLPGFSNDPVKLKEALAGEFKAEMGTRLFDAVHKGMRLLSDAKGAGVLVIMTDGVDEGSQLSPPEFWASMGVHPVRIFSLGLGGELKVNDPKTGISGERLLSYVAQSTGGNYIPIPDAGKLVSVYRQVARELMSGTVYYLKPSFTFNPGHLVVKTKGEHIARVAAPPRLVLILDASGSMKKKIKGRTRMSVAKEVLRGVVNQLPEGVEVGLRVYGHRIREGRKGDCKDTELIYRFSRLNRKELIRRIDSIKPLGTTPIAYALSQTALDLGNAPGEKTVILVTDGKEECKGDLVATVNDLRAKGLDVKLHIVGFTIKDPKVQRQMKRAARAGQGLYLSAGNQKSLKAAIEKTLALPFTVWDSKGEQVARGRAGEDIGLPAGYYRVVFSTPRGERGEDEVEVVEGLTTVLQVTKDGPQIGVQVLHPLRGK